MKQKLFFISVFAFLATGLFADTKYFVYAYDWDSKNVIISQVFEPQRTGLNNLSVQFHEWCEAYIEDLTGEEYFHFDYDSMQNATSKSDLERYKQSMIADYKKKGFSIYDLERSLSVPTFRFYDEF